MGEKSSQNIHTEDDVKNLADDSDKKEVDQHDSGHNH